MWELRAVFKGKVQGVGFRWTVVDHAERLSLAGTVQNLSDGSVEVFAQGKKEDLEAFLNAIKGEPGNARIASVYSTFQKPSHSYEGFHIL